MNSLVLGFENKINDSKYSVTDLLRHCMIIARKLKQKEFVDWINNELSGYEYKPIPQYRKIPLSIKYLNPYHGWCPYIVTQKVIWFILVNMAIRYTIKGITDTLKNRKDDIVRFSVPFNLKQDLMKTIEFETDFCLEGSKISFVKIIDAVKNEMLN